MVFCSAPLLFTEGSLQRRESSSSTRRFVSLGVFSQILPPLLPFLKKSPYVRFDVLLLGQFDIKRLSSSQGRGGGGCRRQYQQWWHGRGKGTSHNEKYWLGYRSQRNGLNPHHFRELWLSYHKSYTEAKEGRVHLPFRTKKYILKPQEHNQVAKPFVEVCSAGIIEKGMRLLFLAHLLIDLIYIPPIWHQWPLWTLYDKT